MDNLLERTILEGRPPSTRLKSLLSRLIDELGWTQAQLAQASAELANDKTINSSKISRWMNNKQRPHENEIVAVGMAFYRARTEQLARITKAQRSEPTGRIGEHWSICSLLNDLLSAAGVAALESGVTNRVWNTIFGPISSSDLMSTKKLYYGWTELKHYCPKEKTGIAYDLGQVVAKMLNLETEWVYFPNEDDVFSRMIAALNNRTIDAIAPFMFHIPSREAYLQFTDSIGFMERFVVIAGHSSLRNLLKELKAGHDGKHHLVYVKGDASEVIGRILLPTSITTEFKGETELLKDLKISPFDPENRLKCFVTGAIDAERYHDDNRFKSLPTEDLHLIESPDDGPSTKRSRPYTFYLPTAFAVRDTEPKLAQAINNCLSILKANGYIYRYLKNRYAADLGDRVQWEDHLWMRKSKSGSKNDNQSQRRTRPQFS